MAVTESDVELVQKQAATTLAKLPTAETLCSLLGKRASFDEKVWSVARDSGWFAVGLSEVHGGLGMGMAERCALAEELGHCLGSIPFTVTSCTIAALAVFGSDGQKSRWLEHAATGGAIGTLACFEAGDGGIPERARLHWHKGRLYGEKTAVCGGAFANFALVTARDHGGGRWVVLADLAAQGVSRVCGDTLDNSRGYATLTFDGAPAQSVGGVEVSDHVLEELVLMTAFEQIGGAQACLDIARDFALQRRAFGQPIGAFQSIKHALADLYVLIQLARGAALAALGAEPSDRMAAVAAARLSATRAYDQAAQESIQIHGGLGCAFESIHHLHYRRARSLALEWAGPQYWRNRLLDETLPKAAV